MDYIKPVWPSFNPIQTYKEHTNSVDFVCVVPEDKTKFISASHDKTAKVWDINKPDSIGTFKSHAIGLWGCAVNPHNSTTVTCSSDGIIKMWDYKTLKPIKDIKSHTKRAYCARFSSDGAKLLTCGGDQIVNLWDLKNLSKPEKTFHSNLFISAQCICYILHDDLQVHHCFYI